MFILILVIHTLLCVLLVCLVLLQQGKGAEAGASLSGGSNTVFGAGGAIDFIGRLTTGVAISFMVTSVLLVRSYNSRGANILQGADVLQGSLFDEADAPKVAPQVTEDAAAKSEGANKVVQEDGGKVPAVEGAVAPAAVTSAPAVGAAEVTVPKENAAAPAAVVNSPVAAATAELPVAASQQAAVEPPKPQAAPAKP